MRSLKINKKIATLDDIEEESLRNTILNNIEQGYRLIHPKAVYRTCEICSVEDEVVTLQESATLLRGQSMTKLLSLCKKVTLLAVTIGDQLEKKVESLGTTSITDGFILDAVGSTMADYFAQKVDVLISSQQILRQGYKPTTRYSPGYGDWSLTNQTELLTILSADKIGLGVNESCILIPRKSVTALIGWQEGSEVD